ncbi:MAG: metabolite traffic protein EboE [Gemmatimonadetes bacterium]|nr:metabolite traffic protein EboE [Gemmatimonadota bacterium]
MRLPGPGERHLTYCTNIHPGESWAEVRSNLDRFVLPVRARVAPGAPFGVGLRLSGRAARELGEPGQLDEFRAFLREHALYVFTLNGFPHGAFHGQPVKEDVYRPDWLEDERLAYTDLLAELLAALLPRGIEGTISTVPGAFGPRVAGERDAADMAARMARHVHRLLRLAESTGRRIALALEPEPCCHLETVADALEFFARHLIGGAGVETLAREAGLARAEAEAALRAHAGICLDTCHMAVEFEDPAAVLARLRDAGIRVLKVQVSAGLRATRLDGPARQALAAFADGVYLHQVVERRGDGGLRRYLDLPDALAAAEGAPGQDREWRVHFHVPLFHPRLGLFESTRDYAREVLECVRAESGCRHFEVETYTWDVLPEEFRAGGIVAAVAKELDWAMAHLDGRAAAAAV